MPQGGLIALLYVVMLGASLISLAIAVPLILYILVLPARVAYIGRYGKPETVQKFIRRHANNPAMLFRIRLARYFIVVTLAAAALFATFNLIRNATSGGPARAWDDGYAPFLLFWWLLVLSLTAFSYVYEFYALKPLSERKVLSWNYALIFVFNLALPLLFCLVFAVGQQFKIVDYVDERVLGIAPSAIVVAIKEPSVCDRALARMGLRATRDMTGPQDMGHAMLWVDQYLRAVTFGVLDPFDCSFTDVRNNPANIGMGLFVVLFRLIVSAFSISVLLLPVHRLFRLLTRRAAKAVA